MPAKGSRYSREEDKTIREFAGKKTAEEIGTILSRTKHGIHARINHLGISGMLVGENHRSSKLSNLQVQMLVALYCAGFTVNEIHKAAFSHVTLSTVDDVASARTHQERIEI